MPIGFDPKETVDVRLDCLDKHLPPEQRAIITLRQLTSGQVKQLERLREQASAAVRETESDDLLNRALLLAIAGWKGLKDHAGVDVPFGPEALDEFTSRAKFAMAAEIPLALLLTPAEKKVSGSSAISTSASSANDAGQASA